MVIGDWSATSRQLVAHYQQLVSVVSDLYPTTDDEWPNIVYNDHQSEVQGVYAWSPEVALTASQAVEAALSTMPQDDTCTVTKARVDAAVDVASSRTRQWCCTGSLLYGSSEEREMRNVLNEAMHQQKATV